MNDRKLCIIFKDFQSNYLTDELTKQLNTSKLYNIVINIESINKYVNKYKNNENVSFFIYISMENINKLNDVLLPQFRYYLYIYNQFKIDHLNYLDINELIKLSIYTFFPSDLELEFVNHYFENQINLDLNMKYKCKVIPPFIKYNMKNLTLEDRLDILIICEIPEEYKDLFNLLNKLEYSYKIVNNINNFLLNNNQFNLNDFKIIIELKNNNKIFNPLQLHQYLSSNSEIIIEIVKENEQNFITNNYNKSINYFNKSDKLYLNSISEIIKNKLNLNEEILKKNYEEKIKFIENFNLEIKNMVNIFIINDITTSFLFNKYHLNLSEPNFKLEYKIIQEEKFDNKLIAHLHCFNLNEFDKIYKQYITSIKKLFSIIVTYCKGENNSKELINCCILKIKNQGLDIGAKFCMIDYVEKMNLKYSHILFLHSKKNIEKRTKYFEIVNSTYEKEILKLIKKNYDGIFPNVPKYDNFKINQLTPNKIYVNELAKLLNINLDTNQYIGGNCMILSHRIIKKLFVDNLKCIYNLLNNESSFDINWFYWYYKPVDTNIINMYKLFKIGKLYGSNINNPNNKYLYEIYGIKSKREKLPSEYYNHLFNKSISGFNYPDSMIEHAFERLYINVIKSFNNYNYKIINKDTEKTKEIKEIKEINKINDISEIKLKITTNKFNKIYQINNTKKYTEPNKNMEKTLNLETQNINKTRKLKEQIEITERRNLKEQIEIEEKRKLKQEKEIEEKRKLKEQIEIEEKRKLKEEKEIKKKLKDKKKLEENKNKKDIENLKKVINKNNKVKIIELNILEEPNKIDDKKKIEDKNLEERKQIKQVFKLANHLNYKYLL